MSRLSRLIPALFVAIALAACSDAGNSPLGPDGPSYDSGVGAMGGNYTDTTVTTTSITPTPEPTDTTSRTGVGAMGGN
jgi:hypothetical protein